jgi:hypothetical protein
MWQARSARASKGDGQHHPRGIILCEETNESILPASPRLPTRPFPPARHGSHPIIHEISSATVSPGPPERVSLIAGTFAAGLHISQPVNFERKRRLLGSPKEGATNKIGYNLPKTGLRVVEACRAG